MLNPVFRRPKLRKAAESRVDPMVGQLLTSYLERCGLEAEDVPKAGHTASDGRFPVV